MMLQMTYQVLASDWSYHCHLHWNWCYAANINNILYIHSQKKNHYNIPGTCILQSYLPLSFQSKYLWSMTYTIIFLPQLLSKAWVQSNTILNCSDALNLSIQSNLSNMKLSGPKKKVSVIKVSGLEGFCNALKVETEF